MESLSRPFHRRKLSNANSFSGKNAYDGVFSGHRPKFHGVPPVNVEEYHEIFSSSQAASSIPVLDLSSLEECSDGLNLEDGSLKPDYGKIFGGFRDQDIAVSYEELVARDKARATSSASPKLQELGDLSHQLSDDFKQFNLSYNKISKTSRDGLDGKTHVTQLHAVPGFTCFIDESASKQKKETKNQKSSKSNNIHPSVNYSKQEQASGNDVDSESKDREDESLSDNRDLKASQANLKSHTSKVSTPPAVSQPKKEIENQKSSISDNIHPNANSSKQDFPEKHAFQSGVESKSKDHVHEYLSDDRHLKAFQANLESHPTKVSSSLAVSQPKKEAENQKSSVSNNKHSNVNSSKRDFPEKQAFRSDMESKSKDRVDEHLFDDRDLKAFQANPESHSTKVSSSLSGSQPKKETQKQKSSVTNIVHPSVNSKKVDFPEKKIAQNNIQADHSSHPSKVSSTPAKSATKLDNLSDCQKKSTPTSEEFPPAFFDEHLDVNSAAAALRKAIEKAQESIRIAKESVGRKKEGLRGFTSRSFKDSLKVKARAPNVGAGVGAEQKRKEDTMKRDHKQGGDAVIFPDFENGEKLFGAKKVIKEIHGKISESTNSSEMPVSTPFKLRDDKIECDSKEAVGKTESESVENNTCEAAAKDNEKHGGFLVIESCEKKLGDTESKENKDEMKPNNTQNLARKLKNLTVFEKVESEKKTSQDSYQNDYDKRFSEEALVLLENKKEEVFEQEQEQEQEQDENVANSEKQVEDERESKENLDTESHREEDRDGKFYDVYEVEMIKNAQTNSIATNEVSPSEYFKIKQRVNQKVEETGESLEKFEEAETYENSSSDYDDAEGSESVHGASNIVDDTEETCRVNQNDNDPESSQEIDEVSSRLPQEFQRQDAEVPEKLIFEDISADQTPIEANENDCEGKSDDLSDRGLADMDFGQNHIQSDSSLDTIHGMEIEVKEYNETEETVEKETVVSVEKEEKNLQQFHEARPEIRTEMEAGTSQEPKDESRESGPNKVVEKENNKRIEEKTAEEKERERIRLAVERAIREARERAFVEARERAERTAVEKAKVAKVSDKISAQSKLKAERAAVERATAEARQRALEKAISQKKISEPKVQVNEIKQTSSPSTGHTSTESALRSKAKLEKHNRIMERAAKALAEKEKRDLLALKEQAERNRLAENLDADIKRWSTGKEGNLRALLSTLQYILGADSGWQAVSLTEIITTNAVKKAYRKATLCVHPDKLQQRGASIQQKYICEKVFDLLKAAWNKFNSEER